MRAAAHAIALAFLASCVSTPTSVRDLHGHPLDPLGSSDARAIVLVFADPQCPISNTFAPELRRIADEFTPRGVRFFLVYADAQRTPTELRAHAEAYGYPMPALHDTEHALVQRAGATVTPEACVFTPAGELVYRGRIDDRYVDFGKQRAAPTTRDLRAALELTLSEGTPTWPWPPAIGCAIPGR